MSNALYDFLNKIQRWLPALGIFYVGLSAIWSLPYGNEVNKTIALIATLLATTLEIFSAEWYKEYQIRVRKVGKNDE